MRILVTNDDGIDSVGLHVLARAVRPCGEVVVIAPDREYSGASAAFGALHLIHPEVHRTSIDGIDEAWAVSGPPALCVMFARLGAFGPALRPGRRRHQPGRQRRSVRVPLRHRGRRAHRPQRRHQRRRRQPERHRLRRRGPGLGRDADQPAVGHRGRGRPRRGGAARRRPARRARSWSTSTCPTCRSTRSRAGARRASACYHRGRCRRPCSNPGSATRTATT